MLMEKLVGININRCKVMVDRCWVHQEGDGRLKFRRALGKKRCENREQTVDVSVVGG
jgi:hypothetical protein